MDAKKRNAFKINSYFKKTNLVIGFFTFKFNKGANNKDENY